MFYYSYKMLIFIKSSPPGRIHEFLSRPHDASQLHQKSHHQRSLLVGRPHELQGLSHGGRGPPQRGLCPRSTSEHTILTLAGTGIRKTFR